MSDPAAGAERTARRWAGAALALGWGLFFAPQLLSSRLPYYRDTLVTLLPIRAFLHQRLRAGQLPQWFPFEGLGTAFIGQLVTATFHPQTLLFLPLPAVLALKWNMLLWYLAGALGAYRFARELGASRTASVCAGFVQAFAGYPLGVSNNLVYLLGVCTLPWVGWAAARLARAQRARDAAVLAAVWGSLILGGELQAFALGGLLVGALALGGRAGTVRSRLSWAGAAGLLALGLGAVEWLPGIFVAGQSLRGQGIPAPSLGTYWALHPLRLPELLLAGWVPDEVRFRVAGELFSGPPAVFSTTVFLGAITLLLAGAGLRAPAPRVRLALAGLAVLGVWLALGDPGGLLPLLGQALPPLRRFRFPEKYLALTAATLPALVALGFDRLARRPLAALPIAGVLAALLGAAALLGTRAVPWLWALQGHPLAEGDPVRELVGAAWSGAAWSSLGFVAALGLLALLARSRPALWSALPALLFLELLVGNHAHFPMVEAGAITEPNPFAEEIHRAGTAQLEPRVVSVGPVNLPSTVSLGDGARWTRGTRRALRADASALEGIGSLGFNLPGTSLRLAQLLGERAQWAPALGGRLGACFLTDAPGAPLGPDAQRLLEAPELQISLARIPCLAQVRLAGAVPVRSAEAAVRRLRQDPSPERVGWEGGPALATPGGTVRAERSSPEHLVIEVEADRPAALVVSSLYAAGWTAAVDGAPATVHPADAALVGLEIPAGRHRVQLDYRTPGLAAGGAISGLTLLGLIALGRLVRRRAPPAPVPDPRRSLDLERQ